MGRRVLASKVHEAASRPTMACSGRAVVGASRPPLKPVFARQMMKRLGLIAAHVGAWLVGILGVALFAAIWPSLGPGVDINVSDSSFVVLHGHFTLLPVMWVGAVTFVAWKCRSLNLFIRLSWLTMGLHVLAAILLLRTLRTVPVGAGGNAVTILIPSDPTLGYAYLGSALATVGLCLAGSALSLVRSGRLVRTATA